MEPALPRDRDRGRRAYARSISAAVSPYRHIASRSKSRIEEADPGLRRTRIVFQLRRGMRCMRMAAPQAHGRNSWCSTRTPENCSVRASFHAWWARHFVVGVRECTAWRKNRSTTLVRKEPLSRVLESTEPTEPKPVREDAYSVEPQDARTGAALETRLCRMRSCPEPGPACTWAAPALESAMPLLLGQRGNKVGETELATHDPSDVRHAGH